MKNLKERFDKKFKMDSNGAIYIPRVDTLYGKTEYEQLKQFIQKEFQAQETHYEEIIEKMISTPYNGVDTQDGSYTSGYNDHRSIVIKIAKENNIKIKEE